MTPIQLLIEGDPTTGGIRMQGPIDDPRIFHWLLGEALRVCERRANEREVAAQNGHSKITLVGAVPPGMMP